MAKKRAKTWAGRLQIVLFSSLILIFYRLILMTTKTIEIGREHRDSLQKKNVPRIYSGWHSNVFFGPALGSGENVAAIISSRGSGEIFARIARKLGHKTIPGSSSRRGIFALRRMVLHLKKRGAVAVSPDGPWGPPLKVKSGLILAAGISGAAIMPTHFECTRQWTRTRTWDNQRIPKPFSTVVISYGEPIYIKRKTNTNKLEESRRQVEKAMIENMNLCREKVRQINQTN